MNKRPYLPVFADTFIADTVHLSAEDCAAYVRLTFLMWQQPGGTGWIPELDKEIARKLRKQVRAWRRIKEHLRPLLVFDGGMISTTYIQKEIGRSYAHSARGMAGAVKRWPNGEKTGEKQAKNGSFVDPIFNENNGLADSTHPHPQIKKGEGAGARAWPSDGQRTPPRNKSNHLPTKATSRKGLQGRSSRGSRTKHLRTRFPRSAARSRPRSAAMARKRKDDDELIWPDPDGVNLIVDFCLYSTKVGELPVEGHVIKLAMGALRDQRQIFRRDGSPDPHGAPRLERLDPIRPRHEPEARWPNRTNR